MYTKYLKRILDIIISLTGLITLFPLMLIIALVIKLDGTGPVIFKQKRLGFQQREFIIYKLRTMITNAYEFGGATTYKGDPRITRIGALLRKTSLDEIPQLINILKGDMSIIGPRPILKEEFEPYRDNKHYATRYNVYPGLFCTVDIEHRANASRELQFEMDAKYIEDLSMQLDFLVFSRTLLTVLKQKNIYAKASITSKRV